MNGETPIALQNLRADIEIVRTAGTGEPTWVIHDALKHKYFQINDETRKILEIWRSELTVDELLEEAQQIHQLELDENQVLGLIQFLKTNNLLTPEDSYDWREYSQRAQALKPGLLKKLMHNYVFFKIPLVRPQNFLNRLLPLVAIFYSPLFLVMTALCAIIGLYLVSHQWEVFTANIHRFFSFEGAVLFGFALIALKALHELGHAFTAARFGVQVPTMGVALFLLTPLLYTDVSDAWRLRSRKSRLLISAAGIVTELIVASIATLVWAFLPDGNSRDVALILASTGWIMSLTINLNPLIKFDGYYLLSDMMSVDNLQQRSFAMGKWKMRELLFAPGKEPPEIFSRSKQKGLIVFSWFTWIYRLILFTTIALVVYHFAFKLLGIILLIIEIWLLVIKPIISEIRQWPDISRLSNRIYVTGAVIAALGAIFFIPWSTRVSVPAILYAANSTVIYPGSSALIKKLSIERDQSVKKGNILAILEDRSLLDELRATRINIQALNRRFANSVIEKIDAEQLLVLRQSIQLEKSKLAGLVKRQAELIIRAPSDGIVRELNPSVREGMWIQKTDYIITLVSGKELKLQGYVAHSDISRLNSNAVGRFIPDDLTRPSLAVKLESIARTGSSVLEFASLSATNGGPIAVNIDSDSKLVPVSAQYLAELTPIEPINTPYQVVRGVIDLSGAPKSMFLSTLNQILKIIIRESGF